ncbi:MAG: hypothetical protein ACXVS6_18955 [Solirubrobacteraceae bacterium]
MRSVSQAISIAMPRWGARLEVRLRVQRDGARAPAFGAAASGLARARDASATAACAVGASTRFTCGGALLEGTWVTDR